MTDLQIEMADLQIAQDFNGQTLTDDQLAHFGSAFGVSDLTRERLIRILTHLNVMEEQLFAVWNEDEVALYSFDPSSTPKANLILSKYDQLWEEDHGPDGQQKAPQLIAEIVDMTDDRYDPNDDEVRMDNIQRLLGEPITREELGKWVKVKPPYKNVRIGYFFA